MKGCRRPIYILNMSWHWGAIIPPMTCECANERFPTLEASIHPLCPPKKHQTQEQKPELGEFPRLLKSPSVPSTHRRKYRPTPSHFPLPNQQRGLHSVALQICPTL